MLAARGCVRAWRPVGTRGVHLPATTQIQFVPSLFPVHKMLSIEAILPNYWVDCIPPAHPPLLWRDSRLLYPRNEKATFQNPHPLPIPTDKPIVSIRSAHGVRRITWDKPSGVAQFLSLSSKRLLDSNPTFGEYLVSWGIEPGDGSAAALVRLSARHMESAALVAHFTVIANFTLLRSAQFSTTLPSHLSVEGGDQLVVTMYLAEDDDDYLTEIKFQSPVSCFRMCWNAVGKRLMCSPTLIVPTLRSDAASNAASTERGHEADTEMTRVPVSIILDPLPFIPLLSPDLPSPSCPLPPR
jgi:hypothetical protein